MTPESVYTLLERERVQSFFPQDLAARLDLPQERMDYFGLSWECKEVYQRMKVVHKSYTLMALLQSVWSSPHPDLSFKKSDRLWIRDEHDHYEASAQKQYKKQLYGNYPLLLLTITNWCQPIETPFRFAELIRYADHERFRKRGIAAVTLDTVCSSMKQEGTNYLYVNFGWGGWPKQSKVIPVGYIDKKVQDEIVGCLPPGYSKYGYEETGGYDHNFRSSVNNGFFRLTNVQRNKEEHKKAMARYKRRCREFDRKYPELVAK